MSIRFGSESMHWLLQIINDCQTRIPEREIIVQIVLVSSRMVIIFRKELTVESLPS